MRIALAVAALAGAPALMTNAYAAPGCNVNAAPNSAAYQACTPAQIEAATAAKSDNPKCNPNAAANSAAYQACLVPSIPTASAAALDVANVSGDTVKDANLGSDASSVGVVLTTPTKTDALAVGVTLNGQDISNDFANALLLNDDGTGGAATVAGLQPGDNVIKVYSNVHMRTLLSTLHVSVAMQPLVACADMNGKTFTTSFTGLSTGGATVTATALVAATTNAAAGSTAPQYCRITGRILPYSASGIVINFAVSIPTAWNQKSWHIGGGGTDGSIPGFASNPASAPSFSAMMPGNMLRPINYGYAAYGGDSGHTTGNTWIDNPDFPTLSESFQNFTYDSQKKTHDVAMAIMEVMYGKKAAMNYWGGQSQGGREALSVLSRYPADYDGILSADFLAYFANLNFNPQLQGALQVPAGAYVSTAKGTTLRTEVVARCDELDGLKDGIIQNYQGCNDLFDPVKHPDALASLRCVGADGNTCLTDAQIETLLGPAFYGDVKYSYPLKNGETTYPGWGAYELTQLMNASQPVLANGASYAGGGGGAGLGIALVREYFCGTQTGCNVLQVFSDLNDPKVRQQIQVLSEAVDIKDDWSEFMNRGGKVILNTSAADNISNPRAQFRMSDRVKAKMGEGAFRSFARHYVSPMTGHGGGGNGATVPTAADLTTPIILWAERGITPPEVATQVRLTTTGTGAATVYNVAQSRPLCQYPKYPKYNGTGDAAKAESYTCAAPN